MNFRINFNEEPTLVRILLFLSEMLLSLAVLGAIVYFIAWEAPPNSYFRFVFINIVFVVIFAYLNKENR